VQSWNKLSDLQIKNKLVQGLDFKKALFGIWLSDNPVQENLKNDMLDK